MHLGLTQFHESTLNTVRISIFHFPCGLGKVEGVKGKGCIQNRTPLSTLGDAARTVVASVQESEFPSAFCLLPSAFLAKQFRQIGIQCLWVAVSMELATQRDSEEVVRGIR